MRARPAISAFAALLAAGAFGVAATGCGSGGPSATLDPIAQAAEVTTHAGGSQLAISMKMNIGGLPSQITATGGGHFNIAGREGELTLQMSGLPTSGVPGLSGGALTMRELMKDNVVYISSPLFEGKLPNGARWMKVDLGKAFSSLGLDPSALTSGGTDPSQILNYLKGSTGHPKAAGHETVRGVPTTRYEGTISLESIADAMPESERAKAREAIKKLIAVSGVSSYPVSVWIDSHHLVRRMTMSIHVDTQGKTADMSIEIENFDFGPTTAVTPPPAAETFDATGLSTSGLSSAG